MFAHDNSGSTGDEEPCQDDYRGPYAFSEPETANIKDFVERWSNIQIALNLHSWGNLFIHPFNFDENANAYLSTNFPSAEKFYNNLFTNGGVPKNSVKGNGATAIGYTANGESADWMLATYNIYALSPELGTPNTRTNEFFIKNPADIKNVVEKNYGWIIYAI